MILFSNVIPIKELKNKSSLVKKEKETKKANVRRSHISFSAAPDVIEKTITEDWEFILIACDGIWDVLSNDEALKFVRTRVAQQMPPEQVNILSRKNQRNVFFSRFVRIDL